jgi:hypothetical protein
VVWHKAIVTAAVRLPLCSCWLIEADTALDRDGESRGAKLPGGQAPTIAESLDVPRVPSSSRHGREVVKAKNTTLVGVCD